MTFTDEMSTGLTFANRVANVEDQYKLVVKVGDTTLTTDQYKLTITDDQHFTVELPVKGDKNAEPDPVPGVIDGAQNFAAGTDIVIEFYALLNSSAVIGLDGNTNKSKLEYSNNPDDDSSKGETPWDTVITFTYELDVNKIDGDTEEVLQGAQFALQATDGDHANKYVEVDANGKVTGWADAAPAADATDNPALLVSGADGIFKVIGLDDGTYSLVEIKAPKGYNTIDPITLVVKGTTANGKDYTDELANTASNALTKLELTVNGEVAEGDTSKGIVETTVENNSGATLPSTGGIGTTIFYVLGGLLIAGAGIVLVARRKAAE
jgi:fimbrial isopeptide formation D2 family protein/LPXTG-motif cell wall-anchored protein